MGLLVRDTKNELSTGTLSSKQGRFGNLEYRRSQAELKKYNEMKGLEKNQEALTRIQTDEFSDVLKRYYKSRPKIIEGAIYNFDKMSKKELLHYFYNDRTWRNNNTAALSRDVYDLGSGSDQDLQDWALIHQTYVDLPNFWDDPNRTFWQWSKDFLPAFLIDPINLVGFGVGGVAARTVIKESVKLGTKQLTKKELTKLAIKKGAIKGAKTEAIVGAGVSAGFDALQQSNEVTAGLADEYNWKRTMLAAGIGGTAGGVLGAGFGAFGAKRATGKYLKDIDGQVVDIKQLGETIDGKQILASKIDDGYIVDKNGNVVKSKAKKDKNIKKSKTVELKPDETPFINKRANVINRKVDDFFNEGVIKGKDSIDFLKNVFRKVLNKKDKNFRLDRRDIKEVLKHIEKKAKIKISNNTRKQILEEADAINQVGTEIGSNWVALRILQVKEINRLRQLQELADSATTGNEQKIAQKHLDNGWEKWVEVSSKLDTLRTNISDNLQAGKIVVDTTQANRLTTRYTEVVKRILAEEKARGTSQRKINDKMRNLLRNLTNENRMAKIIAKADMKTVEGRATFGDWLNEYTTANLLFDATTHMINILSGMVKFQIGIGLDFTRAVMMLRKDRKMAVAQMRMTNDMLVGQFQFYWFAFKKAGSSFKQGRALGDQLQHKLDAKKWRAMDTWNKQIVDEGGVARDLSLLKPMSWLSKLVYNSYRALQAGDTFMKQAFNRATRAAHVNHRMRAENPKLWNSKKNWTPKVSAVKEDQIVKHIDEVIRYEKRHIDKDGNPDKSKWNTKRIEKLETRKKNLLEQISERDKDEFSRKWKEMFNQYEDEFGNYRAINEMPDHILESFDDLSKSIMFDPQYRAREATFTNSLRSDLVPDAIDPLTGYNDGFAGWLLRAANEHPYLRVLAGLHFLKVPAHLNRWAWWHTPVLNKLHFQFRAMEKSPDPIIRSHAHAIQASAVALYGMASVFASMGRLYGGLHPDPEKKNSIRLTINGKEEYIQFARLYPLSIPFMAMGSISDMVREMPHIWNDTEHKEANAKFNELATHVGKSSMALFSNVFSANLMTSEMFTKLETLFDGTLGYSETSTDNWASEFTRTWAKDFSKLVPVATGWRWANKELAEADAELRGIFEKLMFSTPFTSNIAGKINKQIVKFAPEKLKEFLDLSWHTFQPKRDPNGNIKPKLRGVDVFGLGNMDTPFKISHTWISDILKTKEGIDLFESIGVIYKPPIGIVKKTIAGSEHNLGDLREETVLSYVDYNSGEVIQQGDFILSADGKQMFDNDGEPRIFKANQQTFADLVMEVKSTMRIDGLTLNDRFREMFDNPNSAFQKSMRWKKADDGSYVYNGANEDGKNPESRKVLEIIRQYEQAAKTWVLYNAYNGDEKGDKPIFYERELELGDRLLVKFLDYEGVSKGRIEHINRLTNGN